MSQQLNESSKAFNQALSGTVGVLSGILGRMSELDISNLNTLFNHRLAFQDTISLSIHSESDLAEAASELLKSWTGELSRRGAFKQLSQLHPE